MDATISVTQASNVHFDWRGCARRSERRAHARMPMSMFIRHLSDPCGASALADGFYNVRLSVLNTAGMLSLPPTVGNGRGAMYAPGASR
jgi:hypothetical protein